MRPTGASVVGLVLEVALVVANVAFELEPKVFWPLALVIGVATAIVHAAPTGNTFKVKAKGAIKIESQIPPGSVFDIQAGGAVEISEIRNDAVQAARRFNWAAFFLALLILVLVAYVGSLVKQRRSGSGTAAISVATADTGQNAGPGVRSIRARQTGLETGPPRAAFTVAGRRRARVTHWKYNGRRR